MDVDVACGCRAAILTDSLVKEAAEVAPDFYSMGQRGSMMRNGSFEGDSIWLTLVLVASAIIGKEGLDLYTTFELHLQEIHLCKV